MPEKPFAAKTDAAGRQRLRVLHVCQPTDGGAAVAVRDLVRVGVALGHDVTVACPEGGPLAGWVTEAGAQRVQLALTRQPTIRDLLYIAQVRRLARGADIMHMHSSKAGAVGRLGIVALRKRPMRIFTPHGWSWYVGGRASCAYRLLERLAARWCDVIIVVSAEEQSDGERALGRGSRRLRLIENGVDTSAYRPDGVVALRDPAPLLVCVGRLCRQKGQDRAVRLLSRLADRTVRLRLVGDGPERAALADLATQLGVADRVEFVGTADPRPHLRATDVVLLPSRWEGLSLLLLEAMACGAAIVCTEVGGSSALRGAGVLAAAHTAEESMLQATEELLADPERRRRLGLEARRRAVEKYDLSRMLGQYRMLIDAYFSAQPGDSAYAVSDVEAVRPTVMVED